MIISVVVIIVCLLIGGVLGYSNISVQDVDRGYTCNSTVSNVKRSELLKLDSSFKPKINYMNKGTEIFNEDKQIYEYVSNGEKTDKVYSLYYKKAKVKGVKASKGMVIEFDLETGCARSIHYGLTDKEFDKFVLKMGEPDYNDSDGMRWNESKYGWIVANYYDDFSGMGKQNGLDGLWGLEFKINRPLVINNIVIEYYQTTNQSGPLHGLDDSIVEKTGGADDYYNNDMYPGWVHWGMGMVNQLVATPIYNKN